MSDHVYNVLFLCTGNSARSILAEALLNFMGKGRFRGFSAGSRPAGRVNPYALELLAKHGIPTPDARSKSWDEFSGPDAPPLDFVFTVCGNAAGETCPAWTGQPLTAHWGVDDPAAVEGGDADKRQAFVKAYTELAHRIGIFTSLPVATLDQLALKRHLDDIGHAWPEARP